MKIDLEKGVRWCEDRVRIDVYRAKHLLNFSGYIDGHKIVEIEPLNEEYVAVKTIGWKETDK